MSVLQLLKNSPKGQLIYRKSHSTSDLKPLLDQVSPIPLSRRHKERESSKLNLSFGLDASAFNTLQDSNDNFSIQTSNANCNNSALSNFQHEKLDKRKFSKDGDEKDDSEIEESFVPQIDFLNIEDKTLDDKMFSREMVRFGTSTSAIKDEEDKWQESIKLSMMDRINQFQKHDIHLNTLMHQREEEMRLRLKYHNSTKQSLIDRKLREGAQETERVLQKIREEHEEHQMKILTKNKEIEQHRLKLEEEERTRQMVRKEKLMLLKSVYEAVCDNQKQFTKLYSDCAHKEKLNEVVIKLRQSLDTVCSKLTTQLEAAESLSSTYIDEIIKLFEGHKVKSNAAVTFLKKEITETEALIKAELEKKKEDEQRQAEERKKNEEEQKLEQQAAESFSVQALAYVLKESTEKRTKMNEVEKGLQTFINNPQMKKYRFDLQRAVNTPINAISAINGSHLHDKIQRLHTLLSGRPVEVSGKSVVATEAPEGLVFCQNLVAKMLVKKGEEQVTSKHDSAFAIGAVVVALWAEFPLVGQLFMGHLQTACPYVLPYYVPKQDGQPNTDYYKSLGYKILEDSSVEEQSKFLRRMSGLMRLYCACLVSPLPRGVKATHPQSIEHAWMWLSRTLNLDPHPDVTAAMIHDILSVTGHTMFAEYHIQFVKLVYIIHKDYLPKLKSVSVTNATVGRLENFLEQMLQSNCRIAPPEGFLSSSFWN